MVEVEFTVSPGDDYRPGNALFAIRLAAEEPRGDEGGKPGLAPEDTKEDRNGNQGDEDYLLPHSTNCLTVRNACLVAAVVGGPSAGDGWEQSWSRSSDFEVTPFYSASGQLVPESQWDHWVDTGPHYVILSMTCITSCSWILTVYSLS